MKTTANWLAGRVLLLLVILTAMVAFDAYRTESSVLATQLKGWLPDSGVVERLGSGRSVLEKEFQDRMAAVKAELQRASGSIPSIEQEIVNTEKTLHKRIEERRGDFDRGRALLNGEGFEQDIRTEIDIKLLEAKRDALKRLKQQWDTRRQSIEQAETRLQEKQAALNQAEAALRDARDRLKSYQDDHWFENLRQTNEYVDLQQRVSRADEAFAKARADLDNAQIVYDKAKASDFPEVAVLQMVEDSPLRPLIAEHEKKKAALAKAKDHAARVLTSIQNMFLAALVVLAAVTVAPVLIKAAWFWFVAPFAASRPPIRLYRDPRAMGAQTETTEPYASRAKVSAISQEITVGFNDELLVHPDFLQSTAELARKDTKLLLNWRFPLTSLATRMVALTRIRQAAGATFVISSRTDPLSEIGVVDLAASGPLVLQPRHLIGILQPSDKPIRISRRWVFSLGALITLQFRYLIFDGPGKLIVQGCRGVRLEPAGSGRSIDQGTLVGFSANLEYSQKRSETFGAYLLGSRGLFNDSFSGGRGFYLCEEMPYRGKPSGVTGRGLEGVTDGLLKVFGI